MVTQFDGFASLYMAQPSSLLRMSVGDVVSDTWSLYKDRVLYDS